MSQLSANGLVTRNHGLDSHYALALAGVVLLTACAGAFREQRIDGYRARHHDLTYLEQVAIWQRCPLVGSPSRTIRVSFGHPARIDSAGSATWWIYALGKQRPVVRIQIVADTVRDWTTDDHRTWSDVPAPPGRQWRVAPSKAVRDYLHHHPETSANLAYAMFRACPQPGMSREMIQLVWGSPQAVDTSLVEEVPAIRFTFGYGVEGQGEELDFVADSLIAGRSCGWPSEYRCHSWRKR